MSRPPSLTVLVFTGFALACASCRGTGFPAVSLTLPTPMGPIVLESDGLTAPVTNALGVTEKPAPAIASMPSPAPAVAPANPAAPTGAVDTSH